MVQEAMLGAIRRAAGRGGRSSSGGAFLGCAGGIADAGLHREDDALYDDNTPRPPEAKSTAVQEEVAARGLGLRGAPGGTLARRAHAGHLFGPVPHQWPFRGCNKGAHLAQCSYLGVSLY